MEVLEGAVRRESPTEGDPNDLIACRDYFAGLFREIGFHVTTVKSLDPRFADHLLVEYGASASLMTGSGSCVYGIFKDAPMRDRAFEELKNDYEVYACEAVNR